MGVPEPGLRTCMRAMAVSLIGLAAMAPRGDSNCERRGPGRPSVSRFRMERDEERNDLTNLG